MSSVLSQVFSSKLFRGSYPDEKPEIDFQMEGSAQEKRRMTSLVNRIARSSPFGRSVLEKAAEGGYTLAFQARNGTIVGSCCEQKKAILLDPVYSDSRLISTLTHEARHAEQFVRGTDSEFGKRTVKSEIMLYRAMEADAQAAAAVTTMEMKGRGDGRPWQKLKKESPYITDPLRYAAEHISKPRATNGLLGAAFKGWYDDVLIKEAYENSYIVATMDEIMKKKKEAENPYDQKVTSANIVNMICRGVDGCYLKNEPEILENPKFLDISPSTLSKATHYFSVRKMRTGAEPDPSVDALPVRPAPSTVAPVYVWGSYYDITGDGENIRLGMIKKSRGGR